MTGMYDYPIKGEAIWPDGEGRAQNAGATIAYNYFTADRFALTAAGTPVRIYAQDDGDIYAGEFQLGVRYYFADFEIGEKPIGLYAEALGGLMQSAKSVPETGSHTNFSQDTGVGFEVLLSDQISWIGGYRLRHISNGDMFGEDNPSQNDHMVYTGLAFRLR